MWGQSLTELSGCPVILPNQRALAELCSLHPLQQSPAKRCEALGAFHTLLFLAFWARFDIASDFSEYFLLCCEGIQVPAQSVLWSLLSEKVA